VWRVERRFVRVTFSQAYRLAPKKAKKAAANAGSS
jgi:hypothetical protein